MAAPPPPTPSQKISFLGGEKDGGDARFYLEDYRGHALAAAVMATADVARLPDNPCRYVMLANWNSDVSVTQNYSSLSFDGMYENAGDEIYYGFNGVLCFQLFPTQNSGLIPVNNTNQILFKARAGKTRQLFYAWFF